MRTLRFYLLLRWYRHGHNCKVVSCSLRLHICIKCSPYVDMVYTLQFGKLELLVMPLNLQFHWQIWFVIKHSTTVFLRGHPIIHKIAWQRYFYSYKDVFTEASSSFHDEKELWITLEIADHPHNYLHSHHVFHNRILVVRMVTDRNGDHLTRRLSQR